MLHGQVFLEMARHGEVGDGSGSPLVEYESFREFDAFTGTFGRKQ